MKNPRSGGPQPVPKRPSYRPGGGRQKFMTELPPETVIAIKVRAAQERRRMHEVLQDALDAYFKTTVSR